MYGLYYFGRAGEVSVPLSTFLFLCSEFWEGEKGGVGGGHCGSGRGRFEKKEKESS